jgi:multimeric flavodoxin WrbA
MKAIAINGSPRKNWNTAILLENALKGASSAGADTEMIHLYDLDYKGCKSCFACKRNGGKNYGKCAMKDGLTDVLEKIEKADALILGSPIYLRAVSGEMRSFLERLVFQHLIYSNPPASSFKGKLNLGFIYTMNISADQFELGELKPHLQRMEDVIRSFYGNLETFHGFDTYQTDDYANIEYTYLDKDKKRMRHETGFKDECLKAFEFGKRLAIKI